MGLLFLMAVAVAALPASYDLRKKYSSCLSVSAGFTSGTCNASWAAAPLSAFSDRLCIATRGKTSVALSVEQLVSCEPNLACATSGSISRFYPFLLRKAFAAGVVADSCWPYTSGTTGRPGQCLPHNCGATYNATRTYAVTPWLLKPHTERAIMTEILERGSVWTRLKMSFEEYGNFSHYKPARHDVFSCGETISSDVSVVVKLVGWGSVGRRHYWIAWTGLGPKWGDKGYFHIARGPNGMLHRGTCAVQSAVWATIPFV